MKAKEKESFMMGKYIYAFLTLVEAISHIPS
jgi:hypothetical protein